MLEYGPIFTIGIIIAFAVTIPIERLAIRLRAVDHPDERKVHGTPVPRLGGLAIYLAFVGAIAVQLIYQSISPRGLVAIKMSSELQGILLGGTIILLVGAVDDIFSLTPAFKFVGQAAVALVLIAYGVRMEFIGNPFGGNDALVYLGGFGIPLTVLWIIGFINMMNFIDGLDGLAAGVSAIAALSFFGFALQTGQAHAALISLAIGGSALGFLRHNFNPARIFMGDSGSMFLGFLFGALTVEGMMKSVAAVALFAPLVIMGVPFLDAALAILRRYLNRQPVTKADRDHLHHRLLKRGFTHRQTVLIIYIWSMALSAVGLTFKLLPSMQKYFIIVFVLFLTFLFAEFVGFFDGFRRENGDDDGPFR